MAESEREKHPGAVMLGRLGGRVRSAAQLRAAKRNIRKATVAAAVPRRKRKAAR